MEQKSKKYVDIKGNVWWKLPNGKLHRLDGPAVEWSDGGKWWYLSDTLHRLDFQSYLEKVKPLISEQEYFILVLTYGTEK